MQIAKVATVSGWITSAEPSKIAKVSPLPRVWVAVDILDQHGGVIHEQADGQRQSAQRH